jgi:RHS repeat-associated protein
LHKAGYISHTAVSGRELNDLRIFKKGLTPEEVQILYTNTGIAPPAPAPNPQELLAAKSGGYRYGFGGQLKDDEISGSGNHYTSDFWEYDPRTGRRWNLDPVDQISISNYVAFRNNPIYFIDPNGARSFPSYYAYKRYATANNLTVLSEADIWKQGHWMNSDVQYKLLDFGKPTFNDRYKNAARVNINNNASGEYRDLNERRELYDVSDQFSKGKGSEVRWMNAAEKTVSTLNWALSPGAEWLGKSNGEIRNFINAGNKAILDDMMPRINSLLSGSPIKGNDAVRWDAQTLADEQNLIQPFYESLSQEGRGILQKNLENAYGFKGDIMNSGDRWSLGMQMMGYENATSDKMPTAGGDYQKVDLKGIKK